MSPWANSRHNAELLTGQTTTECTWIKPTFPLSIITETACLATPHSNQNNLKSVVYIHSNFILLCKGSSVFLKTTNLSPTSTKWLTKTS